MATNTTNTTGAARRAPRTAAAGPAATGAAVPAKRRKGRQPSAAAVIALADSITAATVAAEGAPIDVRHALHAVLAADILAPTTPVPAGLVGLPRLAAFEANRATYVVLPTEAFDARRVAGLKKNDETIVVTPAMESAAASWCVQGGHKTLAAYITRKVAPHHADVAAWYAEVTLVPVPAGTLAAIPDGGLIAYRRG